MRVLHACIAFTAISMSAANAQSFENCKVWNFDLPHGTLQITLQGNAQRQSSLGIGPGNHGVEAPISEQVEPLRRVMREMPSLGLNPRSLVYLGTRSSQKTSSKAWRTPTLNPPAGKEV